MVFLSYLLMGYPHGSNNPHQRYRRRILSLRVWVYVRSSTFFPVPLYSHTLSLSVTKCEKIQEEREKTARVLAQLEAKLNPFFQRFCCPCLLLLPQGYLTSDMEFNQLHFRVNSYKSHWYLKQFVPFQSMLQNLKHTPHWDTLWMLCQGFPARVPLWDKQQRMFSVAWKPKNGSRRLHFCRLSRVTISLLLADHRD